MAMPAKDLMQEYEKRYSKSLIRFEYEHLKFWYKLLRLVDADAELSDDEAAAWLQQMDNLLK